MMLRGVKSANIPSGISTFEDYHRRSEFPPSAIVHIRADSYIHLAGRSDNRRILMQILEKMEGQICIRWRFGTSNIEGTHPFDRLSIPEIEFLLGMRTIDKVGELQ